MPCKVDFYKIHGQPQFHSVCCGSAMAIVILVFVVSVYTHTVLCADTINLEYNASRPFYAGATGGSLDSYLGQIIPSGKPWPSKPEDYNKFSATRTDPSLEHKVSTNSTTASTQKIVPDLGTVQGTEEEKGLNATDVTLNNRIKDTTTPSRSPFAGASGGSLSSYLGQIIPPGKPWPSKPEDYEGFSVTSTKPSLEHKVTTHFTTAATTQKITPMDLGTVQRNEEETRLNNTDVTLNDRFKDNTTSSSHASRPEIINIPQLPVPNRPPFLGLTGGNFVPQNIQPGKPWPARPEDYEGFNSTSQKPIIEETSKGTTTSSTLGLGSFKPEDEIIIIPQLPIPNRPPFFGPTGGNFLPQNIQPGKPWLARPEDYEGFNSTSQKPNAKETIIEATTVSMKGSGNMGLELNLDAFSKLPMPNLLLPFEDLDEDESEENVIPQNIQLPWSARPENTKGFNPILQKPNVDETVKEVSLKASGDFEPKVNLKIPSKLPVPNLLLGIEDNDGDDISSVSPLGNPPTRKYNELGMFNLKNRFGDVTEVNETSTNKSTPSEDSSQINVRSKIPLLSIYLNLEDIKRAIDFMSNKTDKGVVASEFISTQNQGPPTKKPSLAISIDLEGLKSAFGNSAKEGQKREPIKMTEPSSEKNSNDGTQNPNISATINFGASTNNTSIRFNITDSGSNADPFLSIFFNIDDFKSAITDHTDNKSEASSKYFRVVPIKTTSSGSSTMHTGHLGPKYANLRRNVSTLLTPEAEAVLAQE